MKKFSCFVILLLIAVAAQAQWQLRVAQTFEDMEVRDGTAKFEIGFRGLDCNRLIARSGMLVRSTKDIEFTDHQG